MSDTPTESTADVHLLLNAGRRTLRGRHFEDELVQLFEKWRAALLRYLSTFGLTQHDSEEVVQEVFSIALLSLAKR